MSETEVLLNKTWIWRLKLFFGIRQGRKDTLNLRKFSLLEVLKYSALSSMHYHIFLSFCYLVTQSCPTHCDPMDCSWSYFSVHGISQSRILEWVAISFPRGSSWPRDWTCVSCLAGEFFTTEPPGKILSSLYYPIIPLILIYETTNNLALLYYHSTFNNFRERKEWCFHFASFKDKY